MKASEIFKKSSGLAIIQGLDYLTPLLLVPYLIRILGVAEYGRIAFAQSIVAYLILTVDFGFSYVAPREAAAQKEENFVSKLFWEVVFARILLMCAVIAIFGLLSCFVPALNDVKVLVYAGALALFGNIFFPLWYFQVIDRLRFAVTVSAIMRAFSLGAVLLLVRSPEQVELAAALIFAPTFLSGILFFLFFSRKTGLLWMKPTAEGAFFRIRQGWDAFIAVAASSAYRSANPVVLGILVSPTAVAGYSVCEKIAKILQELNRPVAQVIYPKLSVYAAGNVIEAKRLTIKLICYVCCTGVLGFLAIIFFDGLILRYFGLSQGDVSSALYILGIVPLIGGLNSALGVNFMHAFGFSALFSKFVIIAGLGWAISVFPLVNTFGLDGAAWSYLGSELVLFILLIFFHRRSGLLH